MRDIGTIIVLLIVLVGVPYALGHQKPESNDDDNDGDRTFGLGN